MHGSGAKKLNISSVWLRRVVIVLSVLLALSLIALVAVRLWGVQRQADTDIVPDNQLRRGFPSGGVCLAVAPLSPFGPLAAPEDTQQPAATVSLYQGQPEDNLPFQVTNMLPGDTYTQRFAVEVSHSNPVELYFNALVTQQTKNLGQVLTIRVTHLESGEVIYDGAFHDMAVTGYAVDLPQASGNKTVANYEIQVSLPTSAGNEYQAAMLMCDLQWYVSDQGSLVPPQTGDGFSPLIWGVLALASAGVLVLLLVRRKEARNG